MRVHWTKLLVIGAAIAACSSSSLSAQKGNGAPRGKHVFSWNMIGTPGDYEGGCGNGHRVFVQRNAAREQILIQDHDDGWHIEACDATGGDTAVIHSDDLGVLDVYARILGKPGGRVQVCADTVEDVLAGETLCLLGTIDLKRDGGRSRFTLRPHALFDAQVEDILWTVETNSDFRIVQFRVYASQ